MLTRHKIACARLAYSVVALLRKAAGLGDEMIVIRNGIRWALQLCEGIDLTIFLLGMFEHTTVRAYRALVAPGDVVLDVGANVGAHTMFLAQQVGPSGRVIAFEPTGYAYGKLLTNIDLNPWLAACIVPEQIMLTGRAGDDPPRRLYASWPLTRTDGLHQDHCGRLMEITGARTMTLDDYVEQTRLERISFVKIDVDGHEYAVLMGGQRTVIRHRPRVILELAPHLLTETGHSLEELLKLLSGFRYRLAALRTRRPLPMDPQILRAGLPCGSSMNVIAEPVETVPPNSP